MSVLNVMYLDSWDTAFVCLTLLKALGAKGAHRTRMAQVVSTMEQRPMMEKKYVVSSEETNLME